jgi:hypothetical protein
MNSMLRKVMAVAIMVLGLCAGLVLPYAVSAADPSGYEVVAENARLALLINRSTTEIAVRDKVSGEIWYSNPPGAKTEKYQLSIVYYDPEDKRKKYDNFKDSIQHGQFTITEIPDGVAVTYTIGQQWEEDDFIPLTVPYDRMHSEIIDRLSSAADQKFVLDQYELIEFKLLPQPDTTGTAGYDKLWGKYEVSSPVRSLNATEKRNLAFLMMDRLVDRREDIDQRAQVTEDMMSQLLDNPTYILKQRVLPWDRTKLVATFKQIGYLPDDVGIDHEANNLPAPEMNVETFDVTVEYTLDDNSLIVTIPISKVRYPKDVEAQLAYVKGANERFQGQVGRGNIYEYFGPLEGNLVTFPLYSLSVLPFFGAAPKGTEGYIFVPDGSGALLDITRLNDSGYRQRVYGSDYVIPSLVEDPNNWVPIVKPYEATMPVFGMKKGDAAFFSVIESGAPQAFVTAQISGSANNYSAVSTDFVLMPFDTIELGTTARSERGGDKSINVYAERLPSADIRIRYAFLDAETGDYVGMAQYYQQYLVERGILKRTSTDGKVPFFVEIVGAVEKKVPVLGIPITRAVAMTTLDEVREIVDELSVAGIDDIVVKYSGWLPGGIDHEFPNRAVVEPAIGDTKKLKALDDYLRQKGVEFFPSVYFQLISFTADNVNLRRDAAESPSRNRDAYILSPGRLGAILSSFLEGYRKFDLDGIALDDLGYILSADYDPDNMIDRSQALEIVLDQLKRLRDQEGLELLVEFPNLYAVPYAKYITGMPLESNQFSSVTESVPFMQMVTRGFSTYAGGALNFSANMTKEVLKSIEVGASPGFRFTYREPSIVKGTDYASLYSGYYRDWISEAARIYRDMRPFLSKIVDQRIVDHERISEGVYRTTFENGVAVVVNYGSTPIEVNGIRVDGASYSVIEEGQSGAN